MAQVCRVQDFPTSYIQLDTLSVMSVLDLLGFPEQASSDVTSRVAQSSVFNRRVPHFLELCCDSDRQSAHFPVQNVRWKVTTEVCDANECSPEVRPPRILKSHSFSYKNPQASPEESGNSSIREREFFSA